MNVLYIVLERQLFNFMYLFILFRTVHWGLMHVNVTLDCRYGAANLRPSSSEALSIVPQTQIYYLVLPVQTKSQEEVIESTYEMESIYIFGISK